jgi:hypothetical protein
MLKELASRPSASGSRRHFVDDFFELFVWSEEERISAFELCYDRLGSERSITWRAAGGLEHYAIDAGDELPTRNRTPVESPIPFEIPFGLLAIEFGKRSEAIDAAVRTFVLRLLTGTSRP